MKDALSLGTNDFLKQSATVASYYGFTPYNTLLSQYRHVPRKRKLLPTAPSYKKLDYISDETSNIVRTLVERDMASRTSPAFIYHNTNPDSDQRVRFGLTVLGIEKSIAEALILKTTFAILTELGITETCVYVNSMGDKDSMNKFSKELNTYLRKHINDMPAPARQALKRDIFQAYEWLHEKQHPICEQAPRSMQFLSDRSRKHFKEVLEFLETDHVPYEIDPDLLGHKYSYSQTLFQIHKKHNRNPLDEDNGEVKAMPLARGGRCDEIARRLFRLSVPTVSVMIEHGKKSNRKKVTLPTLRPRKPKVYFVQLGFNARLQGLPLIENLRRVKVPLCQGVAYDSLTRQLEHAQELSVPYTIIMGQREVLDKTIIIRDMSTQAQQTIPIATLPDHLKSLKL